jgi:Single-stranded DNA-specific exonuclease
MCSFKLAQELKCSEFLASLLWMKGINQLDKIEEGRAWLSPIFLSPWTVLTWEAASAAAGIFAQIKEGSRVLVYGDYDVDGITATATVLELALLKKAKVRYYIPHRFEQGYGLHAQVVEMIAKVGCDL